MWSQVFDSFTLILILSFQSAIKFACNRNGVHRGVALCLLHLLMKRPATAALTNRIDPRSKRQKRRNEGTVPSYCEAVIHLPKMYVTNNVIAEMFANIMWFTTPPNKLPTENGEALWNKARRCHRVYDEYAVKGVYIEGLPESVWHSMCSY